MRRLAVLAVGLALLLTSCAGSTEGSSAQGGASSASQDGTDLPDSGGGTQELPAPSESPAASNEVATKVAQQWTPLRL